MPLWLTAPVREEPQIVLMRWSVRELPDGDRHLVGYNAAGREGRVSSAVVEFDPTTMTGRTRSGRIYRLEGPPGGCRDAEYVWSEWCRVHPDALDARVVFPDDLTAPVRPGRSVGFVSSEGVDVDPEIRMTSWAIFETPRGTRHFVGIAGIAKGRVSTPIATFDEIRMSGTTRSGRTYTLQGEEGTMIPERIWELWCGARGIPFDLEARVEVRGTAMPALRQ